MILIFPFPPVAWQRVKRGRTGMAYVPTKTRRAKSDFALWGRKYVSAPLSGPLKITARFFLAKPKKVKKGSNGHPIVRPDTDNYLKCVLDGLNGVVWADDSQIVHVDAQKLYVMDQAGPRTVIEVEELK